MPNDSQRDETPRAATPLRIGRRGWLLAAAAVALTVAAGVWAPRLADIDARKLPKPSDHTFVGARFA